MLGTDGEAAGLLTRWVGSVFGVGRVEETIKGLPIYLCFYRQRYPCHPLTYAYLGVVCGLAPGVIEGVEYSYLNATLLRGGPDLVGPFVVVQLLRLISLPLLHAC